MVSKELILEKEVASESEFPRIGGKSFLPESIKWPNNPEGNSLILIASIPINFISNEIQINYPEEFYISVFSTYSKEDYFLHLITYHGDSEEFENIKSGFTKVIVHEKGNPRCETEIIIPSRKIEISKVAIDDLENYTGSKLNGSAGTLQNENLNLGASNFILQLYGGDFPEEFKDIFYLSDALGYLFLDKDDENLFFVQTT